MSLSHKIENAQKKKQVRSHTEMNFIVLFAVPAPYAQKILLYLFLVCLRVLPKICKLTLLCFAF
jgi:hypothetical protein